MAPAMPLACAVAWRCPLRGEACLPARDACDFRERCCDERVLPERPERERPEPAEREDVERAFSERADEERDLVEEAPE